MITQSASFATRDDANVYAAKLRDEGFVRVRVADNGRGRFFVYWRERSKEAAALIDTLKESQ